MEKLIKSRYFKYLKFIMIGGVNALIYFVMLMAFIEFTGNYYLSVGVSQAGIAIIAYINFSFFQFKSKLQLKIFWKFLISNITLFVISSAIVWITRKFQIDSILFGIINVIVIAPISYIFNSKMVFNNALLRKSTL